MKEQTLAKKVALVDKLVDEMHNAKSIVVVDYMGLTVEQMTDLRVKLHAEKAKIHVIKNNISRRATEKLGYEKLGYEKLGKYFVGPSAVIFSDDSTAAPRVACKYAKDNKNLIIKAGVVDGNFRTNEELQVLATLPDKNGMLSMLLSVLEAPMRNLAFVVKQVAEQKEAN